MRGLLCKVPRQVERGCCHQTGPAVYCRKLHGPPSKIACCQGKFLAGAKKETMPRRRLHGKQSSQNYLVPASRVVEEQRPQVGAAGSPYLKPIFEDAGASLEAAWWYVDYVVFFSCNYFPMRPLEPGLSWSSTWSTTIIPYVFLMTGNGGFGKWDFMANPPGLEVASFPYVLRAIPCDDDCRTWAAT